MTKKKNPYARIRRGDPDPTPPDGKYCGALNGHGFVCTRRAHVDKPHIAGNGAIVLAVWFD